MHATATRATTKVAPAKSPRIASPTGHRYLLGVGMHATATRATTKVAPAKSPRIASPTGHRYQMAIEHQTPINKMAIASRAKPIRRASRPRISFTSEAPQYDRLGTGSPWDTLPPNGAAGCGALHLRCEDWPAPNGQSARPARISPREYGRSDKSRRRRRRYRPDRHLPPR